MILGEPATIVENGVSTLKVRDLLRVTLIRWTSPISLTKTPLEEPSGRSAATARAAKCARASTPPKADMPNAKSFTPRGPETQPPLIPVPSPQSAATPDNATLPVYPSPHVATCGYQPCPRPNIRRADRV